MAKIIVIAAVSKNNVIGACGKIPWHIKEDFQHFKKATMGSPVIMGTKTYESLPKKPLPGRINIVLNPDKNYCPEGVIVKNSFDDAIKYCQKFPKVYIIGGKSIYELGIQVADELDLTQIDKSYDGDVYFPEIDFNKWELVNKENKTGNDGNGEVVKYSFCIYKRKQ
jgi:dihydrofolate reductase